MSANIKEKKPLLRRPWVIAVGVIVVIGNALSFLTKTKAPKSPITLALHKNGAR
jgi:hypothetical protein